jgi:hypothetical protein
MQMNAEMHMYASNAERQAEINLDSGGQMQMNVEMKMNAEMNADRQATMTTDSGGQMQMNDEMKMNAEINTDRQAEMTTDSGGQIGHNLYFVSKAPYPVSIFRQIVPISRR